MTSKERQDKVDFHVAALMEHFDAVQILASTPVNGGNGTESVFRGGGNWFARQGMAHDFIKRDEAETSAWQLSKVLPKDSPGDGEDWKQ